MNTTASNGRKKLNSVEIILMYKNVALVCTFEEPETSQAAEEHLHTHTHAKFL